MSEMTMNMTPVPERQIPFLLRLIGARWRDYPHAYRMKWGELSFGRPGWALELDLFGGPAHFSLHIHVWRIANAYLRLPFLWRFAREPKDMVESWGVHYDVESGVLRATWGARSARLAMPWRDWVHMTHEVIRSDRSWVPFVGSWEHDKEQPPRYAEAHPYRYLLRNGERQEVTATINVERMTWRLRALRWTSRFQKMRTYINVNFSDEVGEGSGSWKGGTVGCSYDMRPNETPYECLRRMEQECKFT